MRELIEDLEFMEYDLIIRNGMVIDGTGRLRYDADLGVSGSEIVAIGNLEVVEAARNIDASGLVVAPGFIDIHSHSDVTLLDDPGGESKVHQGVTTEVTGNCGFSPFPIARRGTEGGSDPDMTSRFPWVWGDLDGWANTLEDNGISINLATTGGPFCG